MTEEPCGSERARGVCGNQSPRSLKKSIRNDEKNSNMGGGLNWSEAGGRDEHADYEGGERPQ